jgi:hypothetical protein
MVGQVTEHIPSGTVYLTELLVQVLYFNNNYAGVVLLVGQVADGLSTTLVGLYIQLSFWCRCCTSTTTMLVWCCWWARWLMN